MHICRIDAHHCAFCVFNKIPKCALKYVDGNVVNKIMNKISNNKIQTTQHNMVCLIYNQALHKVPISQ